MHPLDGSREKIVRAGDHLETLDREARRFVKDNQYGFVIEPDPDTGQQVVRIRSRRQPPTSPPLRLGVIVGDVLHELRSALDHLIWQLAVLGTGPGERNQFPVFDTPKQFKKESVRYLKGVGAQHRAQIEAYQPYKGGLEGQALVMLAKLNDIDKHRVVHAGFQFGMTGPESLTMTNVRTAEIIGRDITTLVDGAEIYRIVSADIIDPTRTVQVESQLRHSIAFGEGDVAATGADLMICRDVTSNIIEAFRGEFVGESPP